MIRATLTAALLAFAALAPLHASADDSATLSANGIYAPGGSQDECEFVEGWIWDAGSGDLVAGWLLDCS